MCKHCLESKNFLNVSDFELFSRFRPSLLDRQCNNQLKTILDKQSVFVYSKKYNKIVPYGIDIRSNSQQSGWRSGMASLVLCPNLLYEAETAYVQ